MAALEKYEKEAGRKPTVEGALHAFLDTDLDLYYEGGEGWMNYGAFGARLSNTPEGAKLMDVHFDPVVLKLLVLGILALLLSGVGGLIGGYCLYFLSGGRYNPVVGIAGVSCVPSTAKVAQKVVATDDPAVIILPNALGANICGVITSAILCGIYVTLLKLH